MFICDFMKLVIYLMVSFCPWSSSGFVVGAEFRSTPLLVEAAVGFSTGSEANVITG